MICFLPVEFNRFKLEIIHTGSTNEYPSEVYFDDLNSDGIKEKIVSFENSYNKLAFQVFDPNNEIYDQWNFSGQYHKFSSELCFEDGNNNGFLEVFGFTRKNDSVFLNCFEPFGPNSGKEEVIFVTKIMKRPSYPSDYHLNNLSCKDINGDGKKEIVFMIHSGYSLEPRKIFIYDLQDKTFIQSKRSGSVISNLYYQDIDDDKKLEIFGLSRSEFNFPADYDIPYRDDRSWFMVYDDNLDYMFPPVGFPSTYSRLFTTIFNAESDPFFVLFYSPYRVNAGKPVLSMYDIQGNQIRADTLDLIRAGSSNTMMKLDEKHVIINAHNNQLFKFNNKLELVSRITLEEEIQNFLMHMDINRDGRQEIILLNSSHQKILIVTENLKHVTTSEPFDISGNIYSIKQHENTLYLHTDSNEYKLIYGSNPFYFLRFPLYLAIYVAFYLLILAIKKIQEIRLREKYEMDAQIRSLELNAFRNQMDPHFTFNVFNIIASFLKKGNKEEALNAFMKFSKLIRKNLETFDKITRPLREEIEVSSHFLEISKLRYPDKFEYTIRTDEKVDQDFSVPKMIILTHVENALKHGLNPKQGNGNISINIRKDELSLKITVEDNGVGREASVGANQDSTGLGLKMLGKIIDHLNQVSGKKIMQTISDLKSESGEAAGTRVEIEIPFQEKG